MRDVSSWPPYEQRKYFAARFAFRYRSELTPQPIAFGDRYERITWAMWFRVMFGQSLADYQRLLTEDDDHAPVETASKDRQSDSIPR
jgi:hypothetical protein